MTIHSTNNNIHNHKIAHQKGWLFLLSAPKDINIIPLKNAHIAKSQIIKVQINWVREKISKNQSIVINIPKANKNQINWTFWFLTVLMIAEIPVRTRKNHKIISINLQNSSGAQITTIPKRIMIIDRDNINQKGRTCLFSFASISN